MKLWQTKEWKERREEVLKTRNKCEWCNSKEYLTIDHLRNFNALYEWRKVANLFIHSYFKDGLHSDELQRLKEEALQGMEIRYSLRCSRCGRTMYKRMKLKPKFRCSKCGFTANKVEKTFSWATENFLRKKIRNLFIKEHKKEIDAKYKIIKENANKAYLNFKEILVLCRRCAFARMKGMHLCPKCKRKYVPLRYTVCFNCLPSERKEQIKARKKEIEFEEEVPLVKVVLPCSSKVMVYSDQLKWGGMTEVCMHHCPNSKDINNCGARNSRAGI